MLLTEDITPGWRKSIVLFSDGVEARDLLADQHPELERTKLTIAGTGKGMVRVPIGTNKYENTSATEIAMREAAELMRVPISRRW